MTQDEASWFRDRPDLQFAAKTASEHTAQPKVCVWAKIKRIARYLVNASRAVPKFVWQEKPTQITTNVDSDWAGNKITRKSTSGGAMFLGKHLLKSWSSSRQVMALSSGEAELYGMLKGATQTTGLISMMADFGGKVAATVCSDASPRPWEDEAQGGPVRLDTARSEGGQADSEEGGHQQQPSGPLDKSDEWREVHEVHGRDGF